MDRSSDAPDAKHGRGLGSPSDGGQPQGPSEADPAGGAGLALDGLLDVPAVRAATRDLKLSEISEFTTSCNFCSCGCGMIAAVSDGKLIAMEGDYDHIVNRGSLCVKGISMFATHASPKRLQTPRYRAPGSDHWEDISWQDAVNKIARKIRKTRGRDVDRDREGDRRQGRRPSTATDAIAFMGGAQNTNEECYLFQKAARLLGMPLSSTRPDFDIAPRSPVWGPRSGGGR